MNLGEDIPQLNMPPSPEAPIAERVRWAIDIGLGDPNDHTREVAAALLDTSDEMLSDSDIETLEKRMATDIDPIVQYRIAYALYRCGHRTQEVEEKLSDALDSTEADAALQNLIKAVYRPAK